MLSPIETYNQIEAVCPYCGYEHDDCWAWRGDSGERICESCGEEFEFIREIRISYDTSPLTKEK